MRSYLDFEKPVAELEAKADELQASADKNDSKAMRDEAQKLTQRASATLKDIYGQLTPWQKTLVARHPMRPHFKDYIVGLIDEFTPLAGDRAFSEDQAIVGGFSPSSSAWIGGSWILRSGEFSWRPLASYC